MDVLQIVLSGASDDEAIGDAQGVPTSMSRGKFESAPVIVSGDPTTIVPGGGAARAERTRSGHNNGRAPIPGTEPKASRRQDMADFDPAHVDRGGPPHRYPEGPLLVTKLSVGPYDNNAYLLVDSETRQALLVDAASEEERLLELLRGVELVGIVTTHRHPDHIQALPAVLRAHDVWNGAHPAAPRAASPSSCRRTMCSPATRCSRAGSAGPSAGRPSTRRSSRRSGACFHSVTTPASRRATGTTPGSARRLHTSTNGRHEDGRHDHEVAPGAPGGGDGGRAGR